MFADWEDLIALVQARTDNAALLAASPDPEPEAGSETLEPVAVIPTAAAPSPEALLAPVGSDPFSA